MLEMVKDGKVNFEIVVPADAAPSVKFAGQEAAELLGKAFGAKIMWADETCALAGEIKAKGYSKRGSAPVLKLPANKSIKCKMISAIGNTGDLQYGEKLR